VEEVEQQPGGAARRSWFTASGATVLALVLIYFDIFWVPIIPIILAADSMGGWFLFWVPVVVGLLLFLFVGVRIIHGKRRNWLAWRVVKYFVISLGAAGLIVPGIRILTWSLTPTMTCKQAVIEVVSAPGGRKLAANKTVTVTDPKEVQKLVTFFPNLGQGRNAWLAGSWEASTFVKFTGSDGRLITVATSWDYSDWSESDGHGDWPLDPEFSNYIGAKLWKP
jgi:hypothetical protein